MKNLAILALSSPSNMIQVIGILASLVTSIVAIVISIKTLKHNALVLEETMRGNIAIYGESINPGTPMFFLVIKNFGASQAIIRNFDFDYDFTNCYSYKSDRDILKTDLKDCSMAPGQSRICRLEYTSITRPITFNITYETCGKLYSESMTLDLRAGVDMPDGKNATEGKEMRTISYALQEMVQKNL